MSDSDCAVFFCELRDEFAESRLDFPWDIEEAREFLHLFRRYSVKDVASRSEIAPGRPGVDLKGLRAAQVYVVDMQELVSYIAYRLFEANGFLPERIHSRMALGNMKNWWVKKYFSRIG